MSRWREQQQGTGSIATAPPAAYCRQRDLPLPGPSFAVLLFARVEPLGVAWLRVARGRRSRSGADLHALRGRLVVALGVVLAVANACFYLARSTGFRSEPSPRLSSRLVIVLAAMGIRTPATSSPSRPSSASTRLSTCSWRASRRAWPSPSRTPSSSRPTSSSRTASRAPAHRRPRSRDARRDRRGDADRARQRGSCVPRSRRDRRRDRRRLSRS